MGVSTNFAVEGTVRAAVNRMFDVVLVEDGCASAPEEWHRFSVQNIMPLIATVSSAADVVEAIEAEPTATTTPARPTGAVEVGPTTPIPPRPKGAREP